MRGSGIGNTRSQHPVADRKAPDAGTAFDYGSHAFVPQQRRVSVRPGKTAANQLAVSSAAGRTRRDSAQALLCPWNRAGNLNNPHLPLAICLDCFHSD